MKTLESEFCFRRQPPQSHKVQASRVLKVTIAEVHVVQDPASELRNSYAVLSMAAGPIASLCASTERAGRPLHGPEGAPRRPGSRPPPRAPGQAPGAGSRAGAVAGPSREPGRPRARSPGP